MKEITGYSYDYIFWKNAVQEKDWKEALDFLIASLRDFLVFDNLAVYIIDKRGETSEVAYARAVGREKTAEADANWGEEITNRVLEKNEIVVKSPKNPQKMKERLKNAYMLGLPLQASGKLIGVMNLIRFGGPEYTQEHIEMAASAAVVISYIFEKRALQETIGELEAVQRQMRLQDDFVSTVSHELRTPLGFIKGYSTTLLRDDTDWDEETRREFLTIIDEETDHLTELIENILESARLESKTVELDFQPLRVDALIRDAITRITSRHPALQINFKAEECEIISGDSSKLSQIFENLFSNAIKYAPNSSLTISIGKTEDKSLKITFEDRGPGIPPEHLPFIFDRFYRVPDQVGKAGTGLGLFICKQIIEAHHGKIWAESDGKKGTRFIIQIPTQ